MSQEPHQTKDGTIDMRDPKGTIKTRWLKEALAYIKKYKRLPPQTIAIGRAMAGYRHRDPDFKRKTDAALKRVGAKLQTEAAVEKRKAILDYIKKHKRLPPPRHPLGPACARFRYHDAKFKKASDAALKKVGGMTMQDAAKKKRKEILAYVKKNKKLPSQRTPLGTAAANYRALDPQFKNEMSKYLKKKK